MAKKDFKKIVLPPKYVPKKSEPYMCPEQLAYFYHILNNQKQELLQSSDSVLNSVRTAEKSASDGVGDESDSAAFEQEVTMNLRMSQRDNNLLKKIDAALTRLDNGTYGYSVVWIMAHMDIVSFPVKKSVSSVCWRDHLQQCRNSATSWRWKTARTS